MNNPLIIIAVSLAAIASISIVFALTRAVNTDGSKKIEMYQKLIMLVGASLAISVGAFIMYRTGGLYVVDDDFYSRMTVFNSYGFSYGIVGSAIVMGIASVASLMLIMPYSKEIEKERRMQKQNANTQL